MFSLTDGSIQQFDAKQNGAVAHMDNPSVTPLRDEATGIDQVIDPGLSEELS